MYIQEKIEEIRRKPEHVREKYVWIAVAISMVIIFITWLISVRANFIRSSQENPNLDIQKSINEISNSTQNREGESSSQ